MTRAVDRNVRSISAIRYGTLLSLVVRVNESRLDPHANAIGIRNTCYLLPFNFERPCPMHPNKPDVCVTRE